MNRRKIEKKRIKEKLSHLLPMAARPSPTAARCRPPPMPGSDQPPPLSFVMRPLLFVAPRKDPRDREGRREFKGE